MRGKSSRSDCNIGFSWDNTFNTLLLSGYAVSIDNEEDIPSRLEMIKRYYVFIVQEALQLLSTYQPANSA